MTTNAERETEREEIPLNTWFQLIPGVSGPSKSLTRELQLRTDPITALDLKWDSIMVTDEVPVIIGAQYSTGEHLKRSRGEFFHDFPMHVLETGYRVDDNDYDTQLRLNKLYQLYERLQSLPEDYDSRIKETYARGAGVVINPADKRYTYPDTDEHGDTILRVNEELSEYLSGVRFAIRSDGNNSSTYCESLAGIHTFNTSTPAYWSSFYGGDGGPYSQHYTFGYQNGLRVSYFPQEMPHLYGIFLAPGTDQVPFPPQ